MPIIGEILYLIDEGAVIEVKVIDFYGESGVIAIQTHHDKYRVFAEEQSKFFRRRWKAKTELERRKAKEKKEV